MTIRYGNTTELALKVRRTLTQALKGERLPLSSSHSLRVSNSYDFQCSLSRTAVFMPITEKIRGDCFGSSSSIHLGDLKPLACLPLFTLLIPKISKNGLYWYSTESMGSSCQEAERSCQTASVQCL